MSYLARWGLRISAMIGLMALAPVAHAQVYYDFNGGSGTFNIGTWSVIFRPITSSNTSGCDYSGGGSCANVEVEAQIHRGVLELDFYNEGTSHGVSHASGDLLTSSSLFARDVYFNFEVKTPTAIQKINSLSLAITSNTGASSGSLKAVESVCSTPGSACQGAAPSFNTTAGSTATLGAGVGSFTAANNLSVSKDLSTTRNAGFNIHVLTERFTSAPEPMSIALFGVGLAGLAVVHRRFRRSAV